MSKIIQLLLLSSLCTTLIYAIDGNSTNEIINNATQAIKSLEVELNSVVNDDNEEKTDVATEDVITPKEMVQEVMESNVTTVETVPTEPIEILEENRSVLTQSVVNLETNRSSVEINTTTTIPEEKEVSVEKGDPREGKNIFKYVLKEDCNMTAFQFAEKHSQEEWIEILEEDKIKETIFESCPNVKNYYQERWTDDLYQFFYEASNEDEIPEC